jgi:hypothetical protein
VLVYSTLADVVVAAHAAYVLFVILGLLAILAGVLFRWSWTRNFWFRLAHLAMIGVVVVESVLGIVCPLTTLEQSLREKAGLPAESGSFIGRWVHELLFFQAPEWVFTIVYCLFGAAVLATFWLAPPRWPSVGSAKPQASAGSGHRSARL